jgi:4-hydroxy-4-methyl-2-oxoglutarate aldolase
MGAVTIKPGDILFGDLDGVCVIPQEIEKGVIEAAWVKAHGEKRVFEAIKGGMGAQAAWDKFGIL